MKDTGLRISVAVCTYRRFDLLGDCLQRIKDQTLSTDHYEIIVVDNSLQPEKSYAFRESLEGFSNLNYIITEKCGIAYARNVAVEHCKAPVILFTDDDVRVPPTWCEDYVKVFESHPGAGVIGGRVDPIWPSTPPSWLSGPLLNPLAVLNWAVEEVTTVAENQWLVTANAGYRIKALRETGGFCERLGRKGKLPFWHAELGANLAVKSLGYDMLYAPQIRVGHMIEPQRMQKEWFFRQQLFGGASMVAVKWQKEELIDFEELAKSLESRYASLIQKEKSDDTMEDVVRVTNVFHDKGYKICLEHLGLDPKQSPPPRSTAWPVIYIVTPCMNAASTIDQTILSVLSQAGDFSIRYHIQDGGSTDGTIEKLEQWKRRLDEGSLPVFCRNIVFTYASAADQGMYDALVKGFAVMSIPSVAFMTWINADDFLFPFAFVHVLNTHRNLPGKILWLGGQVSVIDEKRNSWCMPERLLPTEVIASGLCDGKHWDFVQQEGTFFRKDLWDKAQKEGAFVGFKLAGDWNLWRIFARHATYYQLPWPLGTFRKQEGQLTQTSWDGYHAEIDAVVSQIDRLEIFKKLSGRERLCSSVLKEDPGLGRFVVRSEDATAAASFFKKRLGLATHPPSEPRKKSIEHYFVSGIAGMAFAPGWLSVVWRFILKRLRLA
jgi:glycosyltransferase involved in cell wall biosynthesis